MSVILLNMYEKWDILQVNQTSRMPYNCQTDLPINGGPCWWETGCEGLGDLERWHKLVVL